MGGWDTHGGVHIAGDEALSSADAIEPGGGTTAVSIRIDKASNIKGASGEDLGGQTSW